MSETDTIALATPEGLGSLTELFEALKLELEAMMGGHPDLQALFDPRLIELARAAYDDSVYTAVLELIAAASEAEDIGDFRLTGHGLVGPPFEMKSMLVKRCLEERNAILERVSDGRYGKKPNLLGPAQKTLLEAIDVILESFVEAMGMGGAVKEFKKVFEQAA